MMCQLGAAPPHRLGTRGMGGQVGLRPRWGKVKVSYQLPSEFDVVNVATIALTEHICTYHQKNGRVQTGAPP